MGALSDQPGTRHGQIYAEHGQRADDAHRGRGPLRSNERGECPDEYPPCQQHHMGHMKNSHRPAAEIGRRVGLNHRLREGMGGHMNNADDPYQHQ